MLLQKITELIIKSCFELLYHKLSQTLKGKRNRQIPLLNDVWLFYIQRMLCHVIFIYFLIFIWHWLAMTFYVTSRFLLHDVITNLLFLFSFHEPFTFTYACIMFNPCMLPQNNTLRTRKIPSQIHILVPAGFAPSRWILIRLSLGGPRDHPPNSSENCRNLYGICNWPMVW